jgi:hypothetical protein
VRNAGSWRGIGRHAVEARSRLRRHEPVGDVALHQHGLGLGARLADGTGTAPGSPGDAMRAGARGTSCTIDPAEKPAAILMAQQPSNRYRTRMIFKNLVHGAMVEGRRA